MIRIFRAVYYPPLYWGTFRWHYTNSLSLLSMKPSNRIFVATPSPRPSVLNPLIFALLPTQACKKGRDGYKKFTPLQFPKSSNLHVRTTYLKYPKFQISFFLNKVFEAKQQWDTHSHSSLSLSLSLSLLCTHTRTRTCTHTRMWHAFKRDVIQFCHQMKTILDEIENKKIFPTLPLRMDTCRLLR